MLFCALAALISVCLFPSVTAAIKSAAKALLPFTVAGGTAVCLRRPILWLSERCRFSVKVASVILLLSLSSLCFFLPIAAARLILRYSHRFLEAVGEIASSLGEGISLFLAGLENYF